MTTPRAKEILLLHQARVKYTWDDEETYGMIERSYTNDQMTGSAGGVLHRS